MATDQESIKLYLPADDAEKFKALARDDGRTITGLLRMLIRQHIVECEKKAAA